MRRKRILLVVLGVMAAAALAFFTVVPGAVERSMNRVSGPARALSTATRAAHAQLTIADLHADSLLWGRDLLVRASRGHVDLPRLVEGNVALQVLDVVVKTPRGLNIERNDDRTDNILPLAIAERWPVATWSSLKARALHQAARLREMVARSDGRLVLVRSRAELAAFAEARRARPQLVATVLGLEGAQALEGDVANLGALWDAGFRIVSPSHFYDTEIGGSAAGVEKGGLTPVGRAWLREMEARRMIVDLAHASARTIDDVLALATRPILVSHTGVRGTCDNQRNLTDGQLERIARAGGLIGIAFFPIAVCGDDATAIARAIAYTGRRVGWEHVALGSDDDGAVAVPFDVAGLAQLTGALLAEGLTGAQLAQVMGGNVMRFLGEQLP